MSPLAPPRTGLGKIRDKENKEVVALAGCIRRSQEMQVSCIPRWG